MPRFYARGCLPDRSVRPTRASAEVAEHYYVGVIGSGAGDRDLLSVRGQGVGRNPKRLGFEMRELGWLASVERLVEQVGASSGLPIEEEGAAVRRPFGPTDHFD